MRGFAGRIVWTATFAAGALLAAAAVALAHVERTSYWPNPGPDHSVKPAAGGKVPTARSLASTLLSKPPGVTRVVCRAVHVDLDDADVGVRQMRCDPGGVHKGLVDCLSRCHGVILLC